MRDVTVTGLDKAFGAHAILAGLDLEVPAGSLTAILGPSGSGKTTLLRALAGFERADAGTVTIGGSGGGGPGVAPAPGGRGAGAGHGQRAGGGGPGWLGHALPAPARRRRAAAGRAGAGAGHRAED